MKIVNGIVIGLVVALSLSGCGKPTATGSYSKMSSQAALLFDLVEAENGKLVGRMELVTVAADGSVTDRTATVEGQADGSHLSLTIKPEELLATSESISAEREGDELHISGKGFDGAVKRQPLKAFQDGVKAIKAKSAEIIATNARAAAVAKLASDRAQADADRSRAIDQLKFDIQDQRGRITQLVTRVDRVKPTSEKLTAAFGLQTDKIKALVRRARATPNSVERGQISVAVSQAIIQTEQQIDNVKNGIEELSAAINETRNRAMQVATRCTALRVSSDAGLSNSCKALADDVSHLQQAAQQARPLLIELQATYQRELATQKHLEAEVERLAD